MKRMYKQKMFVIGVEKQKCMTKDTIQDEIEEMKRRSDAYEI